MEQFVGEYGKISGETDIDELKPLASSRYVKVLLFMGAPSGAGTTFFTLYA